MRPYALLILTVFLLSGCAARIPAGIDAEVPDPVPSVEAVRADAERYRGRTVRWGGTIVGQENRADVTLLEVVGRELDSGARPEEGDSTSGRFLAVVDGFLDPAIYRKDRLLTVVGELDGIATRKVGEYDYPYPRVQVSRHHLWEPRPDHVADYRDPYSWHNPWYYHPYRDPWYPRSRYHHRW